MKIKLYLDVTNLTQVDFLTGIQRVVRELTVRFLKDERLEVILLAYSEKMKGFEEVDTACFENYFEKGAGKKEDMLTGRQYPIAAMEAGGIFYDIDSVWHSRQKRSVLLPQLRNQGLKLAVFFHDLIPVNHPEFVHQNTTILFLDYLAAYLKNADMIVTSTKATREAFYELTEKLGLKQVPGFVSGLGVDFKKQEAAPQEIHKEAEKAVGAGKYILMVGTIEPRKNHRLVLDAFDHELFALGYHLVFAGHFGWDIEELKERITKHPQLGKQLFLVENGNDATIDYLYQNAHMLAFPSFAEGFGLPLIEGLGRGIPAAASSYSVIREVGGEYAEYFDPCKEEEFTELVKKYHNNPALYQAWREKIKSYQPVTWEMVEEKMVEAFSSLKSEDGTEKKKKIRQMVMLTARQEDLFHTLPYMEAYMPFIEELVICCPDRIVDSIRQEYQGRLALVFLPDSKVLAGNPLPEEHQPRNFFLRCMLMKQEALDDVFIMSDDDYRPLYPMTQEFFFEGNKYLGFYFYDMREWRGCQGALTSFDVGVHKTLKFCEENKYPTLQFNAHIPQIIEKKVFLEMVQFHKGIERQGYDEWTTYFSYLMAHYPQRIVFREYKTMNWPGSITDWSMYLQPEEFAFENFYEYVYSSKGLFAGINPEYNENTLEDNKQKVKRVLAAREKYNANRRRFLEYCEDYAKAYGEFPVFCITNAQGRAQMLLPRYVEFVQGSCNRFDVTIYGIGNWQNTPETVQFSYYYADRFGREIQNGKVVEAKTSDRWIEIPFVAPVEQGKYSLCCEIRIGNEIFCARTDLKVLEGK